MTLMASSHRSQELTFGSFSSAEQAIATFHRIHSGKPYGELFKKQEEPKYSDTWSEIDEQPKLKSKTLEDGSYLFENIDALFAWAKRKLSGK
jgi:hypothetical protein